MEVPWPGQQHSNCEPGSPAPRDPPGVSELTCQAPFQGWSKPRLQRGSRRLERCCPPCICPGIMRVHPIRTVPTLQGLRRIWMSISQGFMPKLPFDAHLLPVLLCRCTAAPKPSCSCTSIPSHAEPHPWHEAQGCPRGFVHAHCPQLLLPSCLQIPASQIKAWLKSILRTQSSQKDKNKQDFISLTEPEIATRDLVCSGSKFGAWRPIEHTSHFRLKQHY